MIQRPMTRELGLVLERGEQHVERLEEVVVAEAVDAVTVDPERRARASARSASRSKRQLGDLGDGGDVARR